MEGIVEVLKVAELIRYQEGGVVSRTLLEKKGGYLNPVCF